MLVERAEAGFVQASVAGPQVQGASFALVACRIQGIEVGAAVGEEPLEHAGGPGFGPSGVTGVPVGPWLPAWLTLGVVGMAAWLRRRSAA